LGSGFGHGLSLGQIFGHGFGRFLGSLGSLGILGIFGPGPFAILALFLR
jgi:hypothetical protein